MVLTPCCNIASRDILTESKLYFLPCLFASDLSNAATSASGRGRLMFGTLLHSRKWEAHGAPPPPLPRPPSSPLPKFPLDRDRAPAPPPATRKPKLVSANLLHVPFQQITNKTTKRLRDTKTINSFNAQALPICHQSEKQLIIATRQYCDFRSRITIQSYKTSSSASIQMNFLDRRFATVVDSFQSI